MDTWIEKINGVVNWLKQKKFYTVIAAIVIMVWLDFPASWIFCVAILAAIFLKASLNRIESKK